MVRIIQNLIKYTFGLPLMIIATIAILFKALVYVVFGTSDEFLDILDEIHFIRRVK